jgi:hypothetical protein
MAVFVFQVNVNRTVLEPKIKSSNRGFWLIILIFLVVGALLVWFIYSRYPLNTADQIKDFGVIVGLGLTALGTVCNMIISSRTLSIQSRSAANLETLKGDISLQNALVQKALDAKATAFEKIFTAANQCYRVLQNLGNGIFDLRKVEICEDSLYTAEGLSANLDPEQGAIAMKIVQVVFNIGDAARMVLDSDSEKANKYREIWLRDVVGFGDLMNEFKAKPPLSSA